VSWSGPPTLTGVVGPVAIVGACIAWAGGALYLSVGAPHKFNALATTNQVLHARARRCSVRMSKDRSWSDH
jgi:hypothetical protein